MAEQQEQHGQQHGYVCRYQCKKADELLALLRQMFAARPVWAFGMNSVHLQPIQEYTTVPDTLLADNQYGTLWSGHIFDAVAEVRWKRRMGQFDALLLTEQRGLVRQVSQATSDHEAYSAHTPLAKAHLVLAPYSQRTRLAYVEYHQDRDGVVFVRYAIGQNEQEASP